MRLDLHSSDSDSTSLSPSPCDIFSCRCRFLVILAGTICYTCTPYVYGVPPRRLRSRNAWRQCSGFAKVCGQSVRCKRKKSSNVLWSGRRWKMFEGSKVRSLDERRHLEFHGKIEGWRCILYLLCLAPHAYAAIMITPSFTKSFFCALPAAQAPMSH